MSSRLDIVKELVNFFSAGLGGSYVLYENGLIDLKQVDDIDIIMATPSLYSGAVKYVVSKGYKCHEPIDRYGNVSRSEKATKEGEIPIHFNFQTSEKGAVWYSEPIDILCYKLKRSSKRDMSHIVEACESGLLVKV